MRCERKRSHIKDDQNVIHNKTDELSFTEMGKISGCGHSFGGKNRLLVLVLLFHSVYVFILSRIPLVSAKWVN